MRKPVREHVLVILFNELSSVQFTKVKESLSRFLDKVYCSENCSFECKIASIPHVTTPDPTFDGSDPNWSDLKIRVQRVYRYVCKSKLLAVQLSNGFMTINALRSKETHEPSSFAEWCAQCEEIVRFWGDSDLPAVKFRDFRYECVYEFSEEHLLPFLKHKSQQDYFDYFELRDFMHNPCQDPQLQGFDFFPPFYQRARYEVKQGGEPHQLRLEINVPKPDSGENKSSEWCVRVDMTCFADAGPAAPNLWGAKCLLSLNEVARLGISRLLSQKANECLRDVLDEVSHV